MGPKKASAAILLVFTILLAWKGTSVGQVEEEQARAVKVARYLESHPLAEDSKELRKWGLTWFIDHPELDFSVCTALLSPLLNSEHPYSSEINLQMILSSGAFVIENPDKIHDKPSVYLAALNGSLNVYQSLIAVDPKARWDVLDELVEKREKGKLAKYIKKESKACE